MPYKVYKRGSGYKACKKGGKKCFSKKPLSKEKAESQKKALYASEAANESIQLKEEHNQVDTLEYFKLWKYPKANEYHIWFKLGSGKDILFNLVYSAGESMEEIEYIETRIADPGLPAIEIFEDPQSEEGKEILARYGLTGDDLENAGQEGYEAIERHMPKTDVKEIAENPEFEQLFELIMDSESEKNK